MQFGAATIDITPDSPAELAGYRAYRRGPCDPSTCHSKLQAVAFCFALKDYHVLLLNIDTAWIDSAFRRELAEWAAQKYNINTEHTMIAATHTHGSPQIHPRLTYYGAVSSAYTEKLMDKCRQVVKTAVERMGYAVPLYRKAATHQLPVVNRVSFGRKPVTFGKVCFNAPNTARPVDPFIRAVGFYDQQHVLAAVIVNIAVHPVFQKENLISPDYPGLLRTMLQQKYGADIPVMILQGFAGDVRPDYRDSGLRSRFRNIILYGSGKAGFAFAIDKKMDTFTRQVFERIQLPLRYTGDSPSSREEPVSRMYLKPLFEELPERPLSFQRVDIPGGPTLIGVSGELFAEYALQLMKLATRHKMDVIPVGYANGMAGYLPDQQVLDARSGYEYESWRHFGWPRPMPSHLPDLINKGFEQLFEPTP